MDQSPIVGTIIVTHKTPHGVLAKVDGQAPVFPNRNAVFRAAVELLDARAQDKRKKGDFS
jgi:hypothetical protein